MNKVDLNMLLRTTLSLVRKLCFSNNIFLWEGKHETSEALDA